MEKCSWCSFLTYTTEVAIMTSFNFAITSIQVVKTVFIKKNMPLSNRPGAFTGKAYCVALSSKSFLCPCLPGQKLPAETPADGMVWKLLCASWALLLAGQCSLLSLFMWPRGHGTGQRLSHEAELCVFWAGNESSMKLADNPCCPHVCSHGSLHSNEVQYLVQNLSCFIWIPADSAGPEPHWCLLTFWSRNVDWRNKNSFFPSLCADTEAVGCSVAFRPIVRPSGWSGTASQHCPCCSSCLAFSTLNICVLITRRLVPRCNVQSLRDFQATTLLGCACAKKQRWSHSAPCRPGPKRAGGNIQDPTTPAFWDMHMGRQKEGAHSARLFLGCLGGCENNPCYVKQLCDTTQPTSIFLSCPWI